MIPIFHLEHSTCFGMPQTVVEANKECGLARARLLFASSDEFSEGVFAETDNARLLSCGIHRKWRCARLVPDAPLGAHDHGQGLHRG
jgi:hypothetical protein